MPRYNILLDLSNDILDIVGEHLQYRCAAIELKSPHFQRSLDNIRAQRRNIRKYCSESAERFIHPGRDLVQIIRPKLWRSNRSIRQYEGEKINIYGLKFNCYNHLYGSHDILNKKLKNLGYKHYKSKLKKEKIRMLLKAPIY